MELLDVENTKKAVYVGKIIFRGGGRVAKFRPWWGDHDQKWSVDVGVKHGRPKPTDHIIYSNTVMNQINFASFPLIRVILIVEKWSPTWSVGFDRPVVADQWST